MRPEPKPLILIVEDEPELAKLISVHLENAGMNTQVYDRAARALASAWPPSGCMADVAASV